MKKKEEGLQGGNATEIVAESIAERTVNPEEGGAP